MRAVLWGPALVSGVAGLHKNISTRRNAQQLAKAGQIGKAIAAYEPLLSSGAVDPYDHLYVGDLHVRLGNHDQAIAHYESAIREYSKLGFHRNGIALCRKILRIAPSRRDVYRQLGHLYAAEELLGDALEAYVTYLEKTPDKEKSEDGFREVMARAAELAPRNTDMALRLGAYLEGEDRLEEAAELYVRTGLTVGQGGDQKTADELRERGEAIEPGISARVGCAPVPEASPEPPPEVVAEAPPDAGEAVEAAIEELEIESAALAERPARDAEEPVEEAPPPEPEPEAEKARAPSTPESFGEIDLTEIAAEMEGEPVLEIPLEEPLASAPDQEETLSIDLEESSPAGNLADPATATREAMEAEQWTSAQKRAEEWINHDPVCLEAVEKLIEISRTLQDNATVVRGLILKGDLLIREGEVSEALPLFQEVLRIDSGNVTAERRMKRFEELGLIEARSAVEDDPGPVQAILESRDAVVSVQESPATEENQDDWLEIGALLDEFKEGVKQQVGENDAQAHYDLGLSHMEMELLEEALEEFDVALQGTDVSLELQARMRELRGTCFTRLQRHREAIHEYRLATEVPQIAASVKAGLLTMLAREHESVGEVDEAKEILREALRIQPDLREAVAHLDALENGAA